MLPRSLVFVFSCLVYVEFMFFMCPLVHLNSVLLFCIYCIVFLLSFLCLVTILSNLSCLQQIAIIRCLVLILTAFQPLPILVWYISMDKNIYKHVHNVMLLVQSVSAYCLFSLLYYYYFHFLVRYLKFGLRKTWNFFSFAPSFRPYLFKTIEKTCFFLLSFFYCTICSNFFVTIFSYVCFTT